MARRTPALSKAAISVSASAPSTGKRATPADTVIALSSVWTFCIVAVCVACLFGLLRRFVKDDRVCALSELEEQITFTDQRMVNGAGAA